jgi:hypothetical protein
MEAERMKRMKVLLMNNGGLWKRKGLTEFGLDLGSD